MDYVINESVLLQVGIVEASSRSQLFIHQHEGYIVSLKPLKDKVMFSD